MLMEPIISALEHFTNQYVATWKEKYNSLPQSDQYLDLPSPCLVQQNDLIQVWKPVKREIQVDFSNVELAINLSLHSDIKLFYGVQYCADMAAKYQDQFIDLIQVWSDEDLIRLQENILGHLLMQKKLKQSPSLFIASTSNELDIISLCNQTGNVIKERIGTNKREILAPSLSQFLLELTPVVLE